MPRKRKRSVSPSKGITSGGGPLGVGDREGLSSIQQGLGSTSQSIRSNIRHHSNEPEAMVSPRHRHPPPPTAHSPSSHYQPPHEQQHPNQSYSPSNSNTYHSHSHPLYHHTNSSHPYHNSPDHEVQPHATSYPMHDQSANPPPNPHAPSHYNFANRAYAQQRDSGFNTFRVNPGPIVVNASPVPPPSNSVAPPLHSPSIAAPPPPSVFQHHQYPDDDSHHFQHRSYSHSHSQPPASTSSSVHVSHARFSPPLVVSRDPVTRNEFESMGRNGARRSRRARIRNGNESPMTSSDDDDVSFNPTTAGGRSRAMVKYLIMKAKYRYALGEGALLRDELESLKRDERRQWERKEAGVDEIIKSFGSDSDRLVHGNDRQAQQHLLDRDNDSTDWEIDMLRELDRERHAFRERERERDHDYDRGRVQPVDSNRDRDRDFDQMSMNTQPSLPGSRWEDRDSRQGEQRRARSSSLPRYESRLDSRSFHYSPHPYRRTPPPSLPSDREVHPDPLAHPSASPAPLQPSSRLEEGGNQYTIRRREHEQDDIEPEYKRYLSPRHQQQRSDGNVREVSRVSPAPQPGRYQSPPPLSHSHQQPQQHSVRPSVTPSHSFRESTERPDGSRVQREDPREHAEQHGLPYEYKYGPGSSRSPRPPPSPALHLSTQEELKREQEPDVPQRPSVLEEYERVISTTTKSSSKASQNGAGGAQHDRSQHHSSSSSAQSQGQSAVHSYPQAPAEHTSSASPTPPAHRAHAQTRMDETVTSSRTSEEQNQDHPSTTSTVPAVLPLSSSHSPRPNSTPNSGSAKSPTTSQPPQPLSSPRKSLALDPPSATLVPSSSSSLPLSSQTNLPGPQGLHSAPAAPTSPSHHSRSNSDTPSADPVVYHLPEPRRKAYHHLPIPKDHHPRYAYAYYPDQSGDEEEDEDVDMTRKSGSLAKGSGVGDNVGSNGSAKPEKNTDQDPEIGTTTAVKDVMDVD